jgi:hypothetical protein
MNLRRLSIRRSVVPLLAALLVVTPAARAAQTNTNSPADTSSSALQTPTNAVPAVPEIPQSVFVIPPGPKDGRDPFYPDSTRLHVAATPTANVARVAGFADLTFKGFAGPVGNRLAIINDLSFATGEEGVVITPAGRLRIRVIEIKDDSVWIEIGSERRELRLRERR